MDKKIKRSELLRIEDILECISLLEKYTSGLSYDDFLSNITVQDAIIRRLEIIGEATKHISNETRDLFPTIPWKTMAGLRDVAAHGYFTLSPKIIWETASKRALEIKEDVQKVLTHLEQKKNQGT